MVKPLRIALMVGLDQLYKRHVGVFTGALRYIQEQGWDTVIDEYAAETLSACTGKNVPYQGIIARATPQLARQAKRLHLPVVNTWVSSPVWKLLPGVYCDFSSNGRLQAEHLLARNYRRFAGLTMTTDRSQALQIEEFISTVKKVDCPCVAAQITLHPSSSAKRWSVTERTIVAWMDKWELPIGVYVGSEVSGRIVAQMCHNRGWRVPQDVAIICGANEESICESLRPTLSSVEIGYDRIGYESARLLDRMMHGEAPPSAPILLPAQGIVVRESSDSIAVDNSLIASALGFIAANCHSSISADDVAQSVNTHPRTLQRHFRKYLHRSIAAEIRSVRIERAKQGLAQTRRPLAHIARDSGFGTATRMCAIFKREFGISPKQYRTERQDVKK